MQRYPGRLLDRDLQVASAAVAYWRGEPHRAATILAVEVETLALRSPGSWRLYVHYRRLIREALTTATVSDARAAARDLRLGEVLAAEVAYVPVRTS